MVPGPAAERPPDAAARRWGEYVGLTATSAALLVAAVVTAWLLRGMFAASNRTFGWIVACAVVALLIDPLVGALERHLPRPVAVLAVLVGVLGVVAIIGVGVSREVVESLDELAVEAPRAAGELEQRYDWADEMQLERRVASSIDDLETRIREGAMTEAADALPTYLVTAILMLFLLAGGRRYLDGFVDQFAEPRRSRLRRGITVAARRGRDWILGAVAIAFGVGGCVGAAAWALDLPAAVSLGVLAGLASVLPLIGVLVGGVAAGLLAFGLHGPAAGVAMVGLLVALQLLEALVARPWVERRSVPVGPTVPLVAGLLGFELYGVGGAIYGIALAVIGLAALDAAAQDADGPAAAAAERSAAIVPAP